LSPCCRYFITATLSPRLRVDNGVKVWWCSGELLHVHLQDELYQASFRPQRIETLPPFPAVVPKAPEANASAAALGPKKDVAATNGSAPKSVGAYRPPGARGTLASDAYRRDDDSAPSSGASTPLFRGGKPGARYIPGAPIPGAAAVPGTAAGGEKKKRQRTKNKKAEGGSGAATPAEDAPAADLAKLAVDEDAAQKKIRNLTKKLKAIDDLKARIAKGEQLEKTQMQKIDTEAEVRSEIKTLGG
jgi:translation initiation factor 2A